MRTPLAALLLALLAACATAGPRVVEPSEKNVLDVLERGEGQRSEDVLWVTNRSSLPIVVVGVTLRECENVAHPCDRPIALLVRLEPGERKQVLRIRPAQETNPFRYDYTFAWRKADALDVAR